VKEKKILFEISQIARKSTSFLSALQELTDVLEGGLGARVLLVSVPAASGPIAEHAERFLEETAETPFRSLYTVSLQAGGRELGKLLVFFASGCSDEVMTRRLASFAGEQLGMLLERICLTKARSPLLRIESSLDQIVDFAPSSQPVGS
jgi:hypothetical protein